MLTILALTARAFSIMNRRGPRPLVICGPSGSGKSTLLRRLFEDYPDSFGFSVSHTTRAPRSGEENGVHYHFVSKPTMDMLIAADEFIETATFSGNAYGTSKTAVRHVQEQGKVCILDIEIQGVEQVRKTDLDPVLIFNNPPSVEELERRLRKRNTETEQSLRQRLETAQKEIDYGLKPGNFHYVILNEDLDKAYAEFRDFIVQQYDLTPPSTGKMVDQKTV